MGRLERILRELRKQIEEITDEAPAGPGELDVSRLDDAELARLEQLLGRVGSQEPRQEIKPRERVLAGKAQPETWERHWARNTSTPPPETVVTGRLNDEERAELNGLLVAATVPEEWEEDG